MYFIHRYINRIVPWLYKKSYNAKLSDQLSLLDYLNYLFSDGEQSTWSS